MLFDNFHHECAEAVHDVFSAIFLAMLYAFVLTLTGCEEVLDRILSDE